MSNNQSRSDIAESRAWQFVSNIVGENRLISTLTIAILLGWVSDLGGKSINGWHFITEFFSERTSVLSGAEIDVANEWVIYVDSGSEFSQVEAHRTSLVALAPDLRDTQDPWAHFARNLRVVRNPSNNQNWLLVADVTSGQSSEAEVKKTIECIKSKVGNWFQLDTFGSSFEAAFPYPYKVSEFTKTYGRPTNSEYIKYLEGELTTNGVTTCAFPYG